MKIIYEIKDNGNNNESQIKKGIYQYDGFYQWLTYTKSGKCKTLKTAYKKIGVEYK